MSTRPLTPLALALALAACAPGDDAPPTDESEEAMTARAREIHDRVITLDTHIDISTSNFTAERNYTMDLPTQATLPKMESGGLDVAGSSSTPPRACSTTRATRRPTRTRSTSSTPSTAWWTSTRPTGSGWR